MRILLIEDNDRLVSLISEALTQRGFAVDGASTVCEARAALETAKYDALILDLGMPDEDGQVVISESHAKRIYIPTLVLTAREGSRALVDTLNSGADDYLRKPFEMDELVARLRALLRRPGSALGVVLRHGNLVFDTTDREIRVDDRRLDLTRRETGALETLLRRSGRVVSKGALEESLYPFGEEVGSNAIEVLIHRLRRKLTASGADFEIHTLRGIGYLISDLSS